MKTRPSIRTRQHPQAGGRTTPRFGHALRDGFSVLELVVVLAIIGVVAAVAAPRWTSSQQNYRVDLAARRIAADIDAARVAARTESRTKSIAFSEGGLRYKITGVRLARRTVAVETDVDLAAEPHRVTDLAVDFGGTQAITFDAFGRPSAGGTIKVAVGGLVRYITVSPETGRVAVTR